MSRRTMLATTGALIGSSLVEPSARADAKMDAARAAAEEKVASEAFSVSDFEGMARGRLQHAAYEYIAGGAGDEITMRWNREAFDAIRLRQRVLIDVEKIDTSVTLLGTRMPHPILLAPTAYHRLAHAEGEVETARGASASEATFIVSSLSTRPIDQIAAATTHPLWFQLFDIRKRNREFVADVVAKVTAGGCKALVVTVDAPVTGARNRSERAHFKLPEGFETPYYPDAAKRKYVGGLPVSGSCTWDDVAWLRSKTNLPVLLKGIMTAEDAALSLGAGVNGIVVSNHGGRELDTVPATISVLPEVVEKIGGRIPVLVDGGVRRGTDVLKALALGANAVLVGRPYLFALSVAGAPGIARMMGILKREFEMAMALAGRRSLAEIDRNVLH